MFSRLTVNPTSPRPQREIRLFLVLEKPPQPSFKERADRYSVQAADLVREVAAIILRPCRPFPQGAGAPAAAMGAFQCFDDLFRPKGFGLQRQRRGPAKAQGNALGVANAINP
jgi:hypothetical protein